MHFHERQTDSWVLLEGRAVVAVADLRELIAGHAGAPRAETLEIAAGTLVTIPEGVAHGLYALESIALLYLVTNEYDGTDEWGIGWDDAGAGITWPSTAPVLSDRDRSNPSLPDAVAGARQRAGQTAGR